MKAKVWAAVLCSDSSYWFTILGHSYIMVCETQGTLFLSDCMLVCFLSFPISAISCRYQFLYVDTTCVHNPKLYYS